MVRAPSLSPERPLNSREWYFLMQHSGAPTRLLDWTESALIALYFAVRNEGSKGPESDAAVYVWEPWKLNEYTAGVKEVIAPGAEAGLEKRDREHYRSWLRSRYAPSMGLEKEFPATLYPTHFHRRVSSQRSCFTIHGSARDGFERIPESARPYLKQNIIPRSKAQEIEKRLAVAGIDEITIFPDLDGFRSMALRDETRGSVGE
jgi:FRG domain